jgi:MFS family permease
MRTTTPHSSPTRRPRSRRADHRWQALALVCLVQFMVILDIAIVTLALPSIKTALGFSETGLQWVISAYTLTFGGLLLLGGRTGDLLGRRRVLIAGVAVFTGASLACGLASSSGMLIAARAVEGVGAAIIAPATLAIVSTTFPDGAERNKAMGIFFAMGGLGPAVGVLAGGLLTSGPGWEWIFFINLPIGVVALLLAPRLLVESRADLGHRRFDATGALLGTSGLSLLVYAVVSTNTHRWGSATTIGLLAGAAALLAAFLAIEARSRYALMPLGFFRNLNLRDVLLPLALHAAGAALLGDNRGPRLRRGCPPRRSVLRCRPGRGHAHWGKASARGGNGPDRRLAAVVRPPPGRG